MQRQTIAVAIRNALSGAGLLLAGTSSVLAQQSVEVPGESEARRLDTMVVQSGIAYRDRADTTAPVLSYDLEFFQRFEPLTVGDMLKRVPSVTFVSDVLEYDGARMRGLDPGYTQILINGKKVPGAGDDRAFFVDRIPAELVERIEIVRSASANRSGDAVAGALNIVLRDAYEFDGAYIRAGGLRFDDGEWKGSVGGVASGEFAGGRLLGGINMQGRYNPKVKRSERYESPTGDFVDREDQSDIRDGTDWSGNVSWTKEFGESVLSVSGLYVRTERTETEHSEEYSVLSGTSRDQLLSVNDQFEDIDQDNYSLGASLEFPALGGRNEIDFDHARFDESSVSTEEEISYDDESTPPAFDEFEGERSLTDIDDAETGFGFAHQRDLGPGLVLELGVDARNKDRDLTRLLAEVDTDEEGQPLPPYLEFEGVTSRIEERRIDPYLMLSGEHGSLDWETGLRWEDTEVDITADGDRRRSDYAELLPSAHLRWDLGESSRIRASLARTLRRPDFNLVLPVTLEEEFGDNDFIGNPLLQPETAWGLDLGWELSLGRRGVFGINLFHREVDDLIEVVNTGVPSATALDDFEDELEEFLEANPGAEPGSDGYPVLDPDSFVFSADNVGDGKVWGVEVDLSTPLDLIHLPDTGLFLNYSWLDSEVEDALGTRRFNNQARYVYNVGFMHDLGAVDASFGLSYRKQGAAHSRILAEEVETRYGADLEAFVEKRFGESLSLRLTASNLLDSSKREIFGKFDTLADQIDRDYDEYELETESSGPVLQLMLRAAF